MLPSLALFLGAVGAAVVAPRDPEITAAPELRKRLDISTYAWYSLYESSGTVECEFTQLRAPCAKVTDVP